jgi:hypothetical protein
MPPIRLLMMAYLAFSVLAQTSEPSYLDSTSSLTNMGPLSGFTPPASCSELTAEIYPVTVYIGASTTFTPNNGENLGSPTDGGTYTLSTLTSTLVFGPGLGGIYYQYGLDSGREAMATPECLPSNYLRAGSTWNIADITLQYYSPAVSCPAGWSSGSTTIYKSNTSTGESTSEVTETGAMCCPSGFTQSVTTDHYAPFSGCIYAVTDAPPSAGAYYTAGTGTDTITHSSLPLSGLDPKSDFASGDVPLFIRWQASDLAATPTTDGSSSAASTGQSAASTPTPTKSNASMMRANLSILWVMSVLLGSVVLF